MPTTSAELRWFADGEPPKALRDWFCRLGARRNERRIDNYIQLPGGRGLGIKRGAAAPCPPSPACREEKLDLKVRMKGGFTPDIAGLPASSHVELWMKWSIVDFDAASLPDGRAIDKDRELLVYAIEGGRIVLKLPKECPPEGCLVELTRLCGVDRESWTLCFEAFGDPERVEHHLDLTVRHVIAQSGVPPMPAGVLSESYPGWLDTLARDAPSEATQEDAREFLIAEYEHISSSFISSEESGESRANVLLGITGGIGTVLGLTEGKALELNYSQVETLSIILLLAVPLLGGMTLWRLIHRNMMSTKYLHGLGKLRSYFVKRDPRVKDYLLFPPTDGIVNPRLISTPVDFLFGPRCGFVEVVSVTNALLMGVTVGLLVQRWPRANACANEASTVLSASAMLSASAVFVVVWLLQRCLTWWRYKYPKKDEVVPENWTGS